MASEYKITYTYTGQPNTGGSRSVSFSSFKASGDTGRTIGQITSITYEHWHTSTKPMKWGLRGRLVLADGTTFVSDKVTKNISGDVVKYSNTFTNLPTPEQFAQIQKVQTLDNAGSTGDSGYSADLYWRATSDHKMRLIVTFVEEPPVVYNPQIKEFEVQRCDDQGNPNDEGTRIKTDLRASIDNSAGLQGATLLVYYAPDTVPVVGESDYYDLTSKISDLLTGVYDSFDLIPNNRTWDVEYTWNFVAVFVAGEEFGVGDASLHRTKCSLHVSGKSGGGVCVCGYSTGTEKQPKLESHAPAFFYEGIHGVTNYQLGEVETGGMWLFNPETQKGAKIYRFVWHGTTTLDGSQAIVATLPSVPSVVVSLRAMFRREDGAWLPIPFAYYGGTQYSANVRTDASGNILVGLGSEYNGTKELIVVAEYTKNEEANA